MITEYGTIKVETPMDERMQKELSHKLFVISLIFLIIGSVGLVAYFALTFVWIFMDKPEESLFDILLLISAVLFAFGLIFVISVNVTVKKVRAAVKVNTYEFFSGYFTINETVNGENIASVKVYNNQIIKGKETDNYLFFYINSVAAYPILKENLTEAELNTIRRIFKLPVKGEAVTIPAEELPDISAEPRKTTDEQGRVNEDPFADFDK